MAGMTAEEAKAMREFVSIDAVIKADQWLKAYSETCTDAKTLIRYAYARGYIDAALKAKEKLNGKCGNRI